MARNHLVLPWSLLWLAACGESPTGPGPDPDPDPDPEPSALARCADPAVALETRWQVDNLHDPITSIARSGGTVVVASADGALKIWEVAATGASETRPTYGTPIVDRGVPLGAIATAPGAAIATVDTEGQARVWAADGSVLHPPRALTPTAGALAAIDDDLRWLGAGTAEFGGQLALADLAAGTSTPVTSQLWNATRTHLGRGDRWITAGHWYGCHAFEVRDPRDPAVETGYWDSCRGAGGPQLVGWFRDLAVAADGDELVAAGDQFIATFALDGLARGPLATAMPDVVLQRVARLDADRLAITLATRGETSELTWWSLDDLTVRRTVTIPAAVDMTVDPGRGLVITASAGGLLRGHACAE